MAWSTALSFSDPLSFQAAISTADLELIPTAGGQFRAEMTKVCLDQLWIQRFYQNLPLVNAGAMKSGRRVFTFLTSAEPAAMRHCGMDILSGDIIVNNFDEIHQQTEAEFRLGSMSLTIRALDAACKAITGHEFLGSPLKHVVRPDAALMSRLLKLHEMVGQIATTIPKIFGGARGSAVIGTATDPYLGQVFDRRRFGSNNWRRSSPRRDHLAVRGVFGGTPQHAAVSARSMRSYWRSGTNSSHGLRRTPGNGAYPLSRFAENEPRPPCAGTRRFFEVNGNENCHGPWVLGIGTFLCQLSRIVWGDAFGDIAATTGRSRKPRDCLVHHAVIAIPKRAFLLLGTFQTWPI